MTIKIVPLKLVAILSLMCLYGAQVIGIGIESTTTTEYPISMNLFVAGFIILYHVMCAMIIFKGMFSTKYPFGLNI